MYLRQQYGNTHIEHHTYDIVGNRNKRAGGNGRVYLQFLQRHGHQCPEDGGKHDDGEETDGNGISDRGRGSETDKIINIYQQRNDGGIDDCHNSFLGNLLESVFGIQRTVGQSLHNDGRRLGSHVSARTAYQRDVRAISGWAAKVVSKLPNIMELPIPPSMPMSSHGRRAEV